MDGSGMREMNVTILPTMRETDVTMLPTNVAVGGVDSEVDGAPLSISRGEFTNPLTVVDGLRRSEEIVRMLRREQDRKCLRRNLPIRLVSEETGWPVDVVSLCASGREPIDAAMPVLSISMKEVETILQRWADLQAHVQGMWGK